MGYEWAILYGNDINGLCNSDEWATDDKLGKNIAINEMKLNTVSLVYISFLISLPLKRGIQSKYAVICDSVKKSYSMAFNAHNWNKFYPQMHLQGLCLPTWKLHA